MPPPATLRSESGPVLTAAATVIGARCGERWPATATLAPLGTPAIVAAVILLAVTLFVGHRAPLRRSMAAGHRGTAGRRLAWLVGVGGLAAIAMARALSGLGGLPARLAGTEAEATVAVRLAADPEWRWATARVAGRVEGIDGRAARGGVLVVAVGAAAERVRLLEAGESAVLTGWFRPLAA